MKTILIMISFLLSMAAPSFGEDPFVLFLDSLTPQVVSSGIPANWYEGIKKQIEFQPKVIAVDQKQKQKPKLPYSEYMKRWLDVYHHPKDTRISMGIKILQEHKDLLGQMEEKYRVDRSVIVALWGTETQYGNFMGKHPIPDVLATLAYEGRRREFFTVEFICALRILREENIPCDSLSGSWAGAMGHCQFMPSSFLRYAVDFDQNGKKDIWNSMPDIFASIANYLQSSGWQWQKPVLRSKPDTLQAVSDTVEIWIPGAPAVYKGANYSVIRKWNISNDFAFKIWYLQNYFENQPLNKQ